MNQRYSLQSSIRIPPVRKIAVVFSVVMAIWWFTLIPGWSPYSYPKLAMLAASHWCSHHVSLWNFIETLVSLSFDGKCRTKMSSKKKQKNNGCPWIKWTNLYQDIRESPRISLSPPPCLLEQRGVRLDLFQAGLACGRNWWMSCAWLMMLMICRLVVNRLGKMSAPKP